MKQVKNGLGRNATSYQLKQFISSYQLNHNVKKYAFILLLLFKLLILLSKNYCGNGNSSDKMDETSC